MVVAYQNDSQTAWDTTTSPKTLSVTVQAGEWLFVWAMTSNNLTEVNTPSGGGLTYQLVNSLGPSAGYTNGYFWQAFCPTTQTFTLTVSVVSVNGRWGFGAVRFLGTSGAGVSGTNRIVNSPGYVGLDPNTTYATVWYFQGDATASSGSSRTWRQGHFYTPSAGNGLERSYVRSTGNYTVYCAYYPDESNFQNLGMVTPTGQTVSAISVEIAQAANVVLAAAALTAAGTLAAAASRIVDAAVSLTVGAVLAVDAEHVPRLADQAFTGLQIYHSIAERDRWAQRMVDWLQATRETEEHTTDYGRGIAVYDYLEHGESQGPGITWSLRIPHSQLTDAQMLAGMAQDASVEGTYGTSDIEE